MEGPSDRVYIKQWLSVFCNCEYEEGRDYQFLYYGGRLLSHYEANDSSEIHDLINVLTTNRNAAIVIDSDIRKKGEQISETKKRIQNEFENKGYFCWITAGKEIENYISAASINSAYESELQKDIGQYQLFPTYIKDVDRNFSSNKVTFARKVSSYIKADHCLLDLKEQVQRLYATIKSWNNH